MMRRLLAMGFALAISVVCHGQEPSVRVEPPDLHGSRQLDAAGVTEKSVIHNYLESWQSLRNALDSNQASLLSPHFVGTAHDKLAGVVAEQSKIGIHTRYLDRSHDLQIVFYSPEGLSIELTDDVVYDEQVMEGANVLSSQTIRARYLAVLTPTDVRWTVRILQPSRAASTPTRNPASKESEVGRPPADRSP